jgi:hypothetical protein
MPNFAASSIKLPFRPDKSNLPVLLTLDMMYMTLAGMKATLAVSARNSHGCAEGNAVSLTIAATYPRNITAHTKTATIISVKMRLEEIPPIVNSNGIFVGRATDPNM